MKAVISAGGASKPVTTMMGTRFQRTRDALRFVCPRIVLVASVVLGTIAWVSWPDRTWERFIAALQARDPETANSFCDDQTLRVVIGEESGDISLEVRTAAQERYIGYPLERIYEGDLEKFRLRMAPRSSRLGQIIAGDVPLGAAGSVWFGQLRFCRGKIMFRAD